MMTEDDWVAAMEAAPTDGLIMGAFADWLDERGDSLRAEFYRLLWETGKAGRPDSSSYSYWSLLSVPDDWRVPTRLWNAADDGQASLYQKSPAQSRVLLATAWAGATEADRASWTEYMRRDAGLFLLPVGVFSVAGASPSWLSWLRVRAGVPIQGDWGCDFVPDADAMYVYAGTLDSVFRKAHVFKLEGESLLPELRKRSTPLTPEQQNVNDVYKTSGLAVATVVFNLLATMNLRPELVERTGRRVRTIKNGPAKEEWTPNWVGRTYRFPKADGGGTHASPRLHWRRGHYRRQAHGTGRKQHKIMWIEPHMVGATDQAAD